jgi:hypothetical protein
MGLSSTTPVQTSVLPFKMIGIETLILGPRIGAKNDDYGFE